VLFLLANMPIIPKILSLRLNKAKESNSSPLLPSYAEFIPRQPQSQVQSSEIRESRQLLRDVYALKVSIAAYRHVFSSVHDVVAEKQERAASGLAELLRTVDSWIALGPSEWSRDELATLTAIRRLIIEMSDTKAQPARVAIDGNLVTHMYDRSDVQSTRTVTTSTSKSSRATERNSVGNSISGSVINTPASTWTGSVISSVPDSGSPQADQISLSQIPLGPNETRSHRRYFSNS
jgi:hypothetical protein